jgi:hypothetical protein
VGRIIGPDPAGVGSLARIRRGSDPAGIGSGGDRIGSRAQLQGWRAVSSAAFAARRWAGGAAPAGSGGRTRSRSGGTGCRMGAGWVPGAQLQGLQLQGPRGLVGWDRQGLTFSDSL